MGFIAIPNFDTLPTEFKPLPAGMYKVTISNCEEKQPKDGGDTYLSWTLTVVSDFGGKTTEAGRKLFFNTFLSDKSSWTTAKFCVAAGIKRQPTGFNWEEAIGRTLSVQVELQEYPAGSKKMSNNVKDIFAVGV